MKKSRINRIIGSIVCLAMVLAMIPMSVFADANDLAIDNGGSGSQGGELTLDRPSDQLQIENKNGEDGLSPDSDDDGLSLEQEPDKDEEKDAESDAEQEEPANPDKVKDATDNRVRPTGGSVAAGTFSQAELDEANRLTAVIDVSPTAVEGGSSATMSMVLTYNSSGSKVQIDPKKLHAIVRVPEGVEVSVYGNSLYSARKDIDPATKDTLITMVMNSVPSGGNGNGITPMFFFLPNGVLDHGTKFPITVEWKYGDEDLELLFEGKEQDYQFEISTITDTFGWSGLKSEIIEPSQKDITVSGNRSSNIPEVIVNYYLNNNYIENSPKGLSYTESVVMTDEIFVDDSVILKEENIKVNCGERESKIEITSGNAQRVKSFRVIISATQDSLSGSNPKDASSYGNSVSLTLTGMKVDEDEIKKKPQTGTQRYEVAKAIYSNALNAVLTPYALLDSSSTKNLAKDTLNGRVVQKLAATNTFNVKLIRAYDEEGVLSGALSGNVELTVDHVSDAAGNQIPGQTYAYPNEYITYRIAGFGNKLTEKMNSLKLYYTFDNSEMYPVEVTTGTYKVTTGTGTNGKVLFYVGSDLAGEETFGVLSGVSKTIDMTSVSFRNGFTPKDITEIVFDYGAADIGLEAVVGLTVKLRVIDQKVNSDFEIASTVDLVYSHTKNGVTTEYNYDKLVAAEQQINNNFRSTATATYYPEDKREDNEGSKTWTLLRKAKGKENNLNTIDVGDLIEYKVRFTIEVPEESKYPNQDAKDPFIHEKYEGQELVTAANDRLESYGEAPYVRATVTDKDGNDVTEQRDLQFDKIEHGALPQEGLYPALDSGTTRIRFKSNSSKDQPDLQRPYEGHLQPGDVVFVTYVMEVTGSNPNNEFWAYSMPTGGDDLAPFANGGGTAKGGEGSINIVKPTVIIDAKYTDSSGISISDASPVGKDDIVNVQVTVTNSSPSNALPVNIQGLISSHEPVTGFPGFDYNSSYLDKPYLTYYSAQDVTLKRFSPSVTSASLTGEVSRGFGFGTDGPVELAPGQKIVLDYQMYSKDWRTGSANPIFNVTNYVMFIEEIPNYIAQSASSAVVEKKEKINNFDGSNATKSYATITSGLSTSNKMEYTGRMQSAAKSVIVNIRGTTTNSISNGDAISNRITITNTGRNSTVSDIIVRLPEYEAVSDGVLIAKSQVASALEQYVPFTAVYLGNFGADKREVYHLKLQQDVGIDGRTASNASMQTILRFDSHISEEGRQKLDSKFSFDSPDAGGFVTYIEQAEYAIFSKEWSGQFVPDASIEVLNNSDARWADWGGNKLTLGKIIKPLSSYNVSYRYYGPGPGLKVKMQKEVNGVFADAKETDIFSPGDKVQYSVEVSTSGTATQFVIPLKPPTLVMQVPSGMVLDEEFVKKYPLQTVGGVQYLVIPISDEVHNTAPENVTIPAVVGDAYGGRKAQFYLLTQEPFFKVREGNGYGKREETPPELNSIASLQGLYNYAVISEAEFNVTGQFAFSTRKGVTVEGGTPVGTSGKVVEAAARDAQKITYTLELSNDSSERSYEKVTLLERLPGMDDIYVMDTVKRGSTATLKMGTGNIVVTKEKEGPPTTLTEGKNADYTIEYSKDPVSRKVVPADLRLTGNGETSTISWTASKAEATMFRITLNNPLGPGEKVIVTFDALSDASTNEKMKPIDAVAVNTFGAGFIAKAGAKSVEVYPEAESARVLFPDVNAMSIKGVLFMDDASNVDGIYDPQIDTLFDKTTVYLQLWKEGEMSAKQQLTVTDGQYEFKVTEAGNYYVKVADLNPAYKIFDDVKSDINGNKFDTTTGRTDTIIYEEGEERIRNLALVSSGNGTLEIAKKVDGSTSINGKKQKFVFKIDVKPVPGEGEPFTFYEVIEGSAGRTITDLPRGTYTVTELTWATGYKMTKSADPLVIDYGNMNVRADFTNERENRPFLHAISDPKTSVNVFTK